MAAPIGKIRPARAFASPQDALPHRRRDGHARLVFAHLKRLAQYADCDPAAIASIAIDRRTPASRQSVQDASQRLGLDAHCEERSLRSVAARDCPVILLSDEGLGWLVVGVPEAGTFDIEVDGAFQRVTAKELEPHYSGTLFRVTLKPDTVVPDPVPGEPARRPRAHAQDPAPSGLPGMSSTARVVRDVLSGQKSLVLYMFLAAGLANLLTITVPLFIMAVYDRIIPHIAIETLWALVIGVLIALALDFGVRFVRMRLTDAIALTASRRIQGRLFSRVTGAPQSRQPRSGSDVAQAMQDVDTVTHLVPVTLVAALIDLPFFVLLIGLIAYLGGWVVLAPIAGAIILFALNLLTVSGARTAGADVARATRQRAGMIENVLDNGDVVRLSGLRPRLTARFERLVDEHAMSLHGSRIHGAFPSVLALSINQLAVVFTLVIGVYQVAAGAITVGTLAAVTILVGRAIGPIGSLASLVARARLMSSTVETFLALDALPQEKGGDVRGTPRQTISGRIQFHETAFAYPGTDRAAVGPVSLTLEAGERVGLVGSIGCGKSTLLRLVPRLLDPSSGSVQIDGYNASQYDPERLRQSISVMTQSSQLLTGTLYDNLVAGLETIDDHWIETCAERTGLKEIVAAHKDGYGLRIGAGECGLSGGEQQIVALTRCLIRNTPIILLDEPTAALDNRLEKQVVAKLGEALQGKTVLIATHRAPLLNLVDRIVVMDRGRIARDRPRDEILPLIGGSGGAAQPAAQAEAG